MKPDMIGPVGLSTQPWDRDLQIQPFVIDFNEHSRPAHTRILKLGDKF
jgi:hypothetical protein